MENNHVTFLEIDIDALTHNYHYILEKTPKNTKTLAVVKAFGYGIDDVILAKHLETLGVDYFGVAYADEGVRLRENGITTPILVLHPQPQNFDTLVAYHLEPNLFSISILKSFIQYATQCRLEKYPIHLKFNSGLNRLGINPSELDKAIQYLTNQTGVVVTSVLSHLAASEDPNEKVFTEKQVTVFAKITKTLKKALPNHFITHISNTSGTLCYANAHFDMVRLGIGLYGFGNDKEQTQNLKNVASLKSIISHIRTVPAGENVSYNMGLITQKTEKIAIVPIGHADGFSRPLGCGKGYVTINGQKANTAGNVCMDMILVNVTNIDCKEGDEVIIFNNQQTVEEFATICNTISYEILTAISQRVKRVVKK